MTIRINRCGEKLKKRVSFSFSLQSLLSVYQFMSDLCTWCYISRRKRQISTEQCTLVCLCASIWHKLKSNYWSEISLLQ